MTLSGLRASVRKHEGYRDEPYRDHLRIWTVGVGHNIHDLAVPTFDTVGELLNWLSNPTNHDRWFNEDLATATGEAQTWVGAQYWLALTEDQREVIAEMCFQLGLSRLSKFVKFLAAVRSCDFAEARRQMLDSRWAKQTPERAQTLADKFFPV